MHDLPSSSRAAILALSLCHLDERGRYDDAEFRPLWKTLRASMWRQAMALPDLFRRRVFFARDRNGSWEIPA